MKFPIFSLGDVFKLEKGKKPKNISETKNNYPYINIKALEKGKIDNYTDGKNCRFCNKNDVLIVWDGARCGWVGKGLNGAIGSTLGKLVKKYEYDCELNYLYYFLKSHFNKINSNPRGVGIPHVEPNLFWSLQIPLPPLPTQQKIVDKIESLFSKIDSGNTSLQKAKVLLEQYRQSVLKAAFEGKLTAQWREKHKGELEPASVLLERMRKERKKKLGEKFKELPLVNTSELPKLPDGWCWCRLEQITLILGDGLHGTPNYDDKGDFYFINGNNLVDGKIVFKNNTKKVSKNEFEKYRKSLDETTIFVSINGTIGNTAFYNEENIILGKSACYFNVLSVAIKQYVRYYLTTNQFIVYAHKKATGSTIKNVGLKAMRDFLIPLPNSKKEQKLIIKILQNHIETSNRILEDINKKLCQSNLLKNSILKNAFEGKLINE